MGTRGACGFFSEKYGEKVAYNHFDSYPERLGSNIKKFIDSTSNEKIKEIANKIILIDNKIPHPELWVRTPRGLPYKGSKNC